MEVKYNSDTYKIMSQENNKSGREVDVACKTKWMVMVRRKRC